MRRINGLPALRVVLAVSMLGSPLMAQISAAPHHPLDPLTVEEMQAAVASLRAAGKVGPQTRFGTMALVEPAKEDVHQQVAAGVFRRVARIVLYDWHTDTPAEATVDLTSGALISWHELAARSAPFASLLEARLSEALRGDPRWLEALRRRGVTDPSLAHPEPHLNEGDTLSLTAAGRMVSLDGFSLPQAPPYQYIQDLDVEVNLTAATVTRFVDSASARRLQASTYHAAVRRRSLPRTPARTITIRAGEVRWHAWRLRLGVDPRRGLELFDVAWDDGVRRPVLYRASISEVMATYGDPVFDSYYPFDEGAYGLGNYGASPMLVPEDAPPDARFVDAVLHDDRGTPRRVPRAVAIYERGGDVLWRHAGTACLGAHLVIAGHATIGPYDYVFSWVFSRDGAIAVEVVLTGVMNTMLQPSTSDALGPGLSTARAVEDQQRAPLHQHFFSYRLDFDIASDARDQVIEVDAEPALAESVANPKGEWFVTREHRLLSELQARRQTSPATSRFWRVVPAADTNEPDGHGYALVPGDNTVPLQTASARPRRKAGFLSSQLWVTPYAPGEMNAAGDYPYLNGDDEGLPQWTQADRSVTNADVVLWYTLGITHIPRPEDYPIMPSRRASFRLVPSGFFERNPAYGADVACR
jgi:primary-amine oxidase